MRLVGLVESVDHVCCRYRLAAFRSFFHTHQHTFELIPLPRSLWGWLKISSFLRQADVIILQRKLLSGLHLHFLRRNARFLIFDYDDAVFLRDSYASKGTYSGRRLSRFRGIVRSADLVVGGNAFLCAHADRQGAKQTALIPTCIDVHGPIASHSSETTRLVWIGSSSTLRGLERIRPILERIGREIPGVQLKLICDRFITLHYLPVLPIPWSEAGEARELADAEIGIAWMPDDEWSQGKCGLKVLQYMAAGLPVVANPVGVHRGMIQHGETGFLADTPEQWREAIAKLSEDPELRKKMGRAGRKVVERDYSVESGAARWLEVLDRFRRRQVA